MPVDYLDAIEDYESTDWPEADWTEADWTEARKPKAPTPQKYSPPATNKGYVTNAVFQTAMDKVRADVAANRTAITNVGSRVDRLSKRAEAEVKKLRDQVKQDREATANTLQMLAILPMLSAGGSTTVLAPGPGGETTTPTTVTVATPASTTTEILPLLLLSGFGGSGSGGSSGGMDTGMLLAVAMMATAK